MVFIRVNPIKVMRLIRVAREKSLIISVEQAIALYMACKAQKINSFDGFINYISMHDGSFPLGSFEILCEYHLNGILDKFKSIHDIIADKQEKEIKHNERLVALGIQDYDRVKVKSIIRQLSKYKIVPVPASKIPEVDSLGPKEKIFLREFFSNTIKIDDA
jgi:hypothetical protein